MYVLLRTDQSGGYVTPAGSHKSYTHDIAKAQTFTTREAANKNRCIGNEIIILLTSILTKPQKSGTIFKINDQYCTNTRQFADFAIAQPEVWNIGAPGEKLQNGHTEAPIISDEKGWNAIWERYKWTILSKQADHGLTGD